ncbi:phosphoprotein [Raspberry vein chlorosis virus]|uniref:Phosphoprotein n=1 Tax=Raspberry vein chlorosis virus TaxID=758677 RepID=A0A482P9Y9_9RHAB|nr:phosphoprotein [Raspberry vein chlorosis virus]QBS46631.1 phosphoprotein [Raspberry vein chlorosis virus]
MDNIDFDALPNPILDVAMSEIDQERNTDDLVAGKSRESNMGRIEESGQEVAEKQSKLESDGAYQEDIPYDRNDIDTALTDLQHLCDAMGVNYTIPMENQVKMLFRDEEVCYTHLIWYLRGIINANQTQIIPTITGAISDMKMETRQLQASSNKLSKETANIEKTSKSLYDEIRAIKEDMKESFRASMKLFMEEVQNEKPTQEPKQPLINPSKIADLKAVKDLVLNSYGNAGEAMIPNKADIPEPTHTNKVIDEYHKEKRDALIKYGVDPALVKSYEDSVIDAMYPDDVHAQLKAIRLNEGIKRQIRKSLEERLEDYLDEEDEDEEMSNGSIQGDSYASTE